MTDATPTPTPAPEIAPDELERLKSRMRGVLHRIAEEGPAHREFVPEGMTGEELAAYREQVAHWSQRLRQGEHADLLEGGTDDLTIRVVAETLALGATPDELRYRLFSNPLRIF